jgi:hypothetical protein
MSYMAMQSINVHGTVCQLLDKYLPGFCLKQGAEMLLHLQPSPWHQKKIASEFLKQWLIGKQHLGNVSVVFDPSNHSTMTKLLPG